MDSVPKLIRAHLRCRDPPSGRSEEEDDTVTEESESNGDESEASTLDSLSADRRKKREVLAAQGIDPYPLRFDRTATAAELHERHDGLDPTCAPGTWSGWPVA